MEKKLLNELLYQALETEKEKEVTTAIGAARAKQSRKKML
jgi:hypothetical protein